MENASAIYHQATLNAYRQKNLPILRERLMNVLRRIGPEPLWFGYGERTPAEKELDRKRELQAAMASHVTMIDLGEEGIENNWTNPTLVNTAARFELGLSYIDTAALVANSPMFHGFYGCVKFKAANVYLALPLYGKVVNVRIFPKGSVSITGARTEEQALYAATMVTDYLNRIGIKCSMLNFEVKNYVVRFDYGSYIKIGTIKAEYSQASINSLFQTLAFREVAGQPPVALISGTGRGMVSGLTSLEQARVFMRKLYGIFKRHQCSKHEYKRHYKSKAVEVKTLTDATRVILQMSMEAPKQGPQDELVRQHAAAAVRQIDMMTKGSTADIDDVDENEISFTDMIVGDVHHSDLARLGLGYGIGVLCIDEMATESGIGIPEVATIDDDDDSNQVVDHSHA